MNILPKKFNDKLKAKSTGCRLLLRSRKQKLAHFASALLQKFFVLQLVISDTLTSRRKTPNQKSNQTLTVGRCKIFDSFQTFENIE